MNPPIVPIEQVQGRLARLWDPFERTAHLTVFGMNGTGKTHLVRHGILPVRGERTVVLDVKGDAGINPWSGWGTAVHELPACWEGRVRLILTGTTDDAKRRARAALELLHLEGFAVVVADDMRTLTDRERFGCSALIEALATEGRGRGIMLVMGAQSVAYATPSLKDQAGAMFVGAMTSRAQVKDLADLTGFGRELVPTLASVPSRRFLYTDRWADAPVACITGI